MSRTIHQAAFAIAANGSLLVNVAHVDRRMTSTQLLQWALRQPGKVFVGVQLSPAEATRVLNWCADLHDEAVAYVIGARQRRLKGSKAKKRRTQY
jgi:hypothetical protein